MSGSSGFVPVTAGGIRWEVTPECHEALLGSDGLPLAAWLRDGSATVIKHGPHRTVYRVRLPGLDCFVKHYRIHDTRAWLRELVRPSKARMECDRARAVAAAGVATVEPLALGEQVRVGPGDSFLVTRTLDDTVPLGAFLESQFALLPPSRQTSLRQRLAQLMGGFLARLHDAGVTHHDLHAGNLLLRLGPKEPELFLIDLHAVTLGAPLDWTASWNNLVMLNRWFVLRAGRADRLRCWHAYRAARQKGDADLFAVGTRPRPLFLEEQTHRSNLAFWRARDRRCLVNNRYYRTVSAPGVAGHAVTDLDRDALAELLRDPDAPFRDAPLLKNSRSSTVAEATLPIGGVPRRVVIKRFRVTAWSDPLVALVRRPAWLRSWVWGHGLRERCLPTPRPLAVFHRHRNGLPREGYLVVEKIDDAVDLHEFAKRLARQPEAERRAVVRDWVGRLARLVRELHCRGLSHRDLKAANVLLTAEAAWLIDLVGVTRPRLSWRRRVQNLARLNASFLRLPTLTRADRLRFLRVYLQWGLFGRDRWKRWWRAVDEATQAKAAQNARRGRILV
jgi:tRNA A-37 threonylcarbamoyl transferase component Bud32